jgi:hypothetical protein
MLAQIPDLHVVVQFGKGIPSEIQGPALLAFEQALRRYAVSYLDQQLWIEVFKEAKGDDSKLRANMTKEQRAAL